MLLQVANDFVHFEYVAFVDAAGWRQSKRDCSFAAPRRAQPSDAAGPEPSDKCLRLAVSKTSPRLGETTTFPLR
jgi:hypothetical protein